MRLLHVHMAMQDLRALNWLESLTSREYVLSILTELAGDFAVGSPMSGLFDDDWDHKYIQGLPRGIE